MTSPIQNPLQEHVYGECIKKIQELIQQTNTEILDIEINHSKTIFSKKLESFKTSLCQIDLETSAVYSDLCTWKAFNARPPAGANEECAAVMETKHTTLAHSPESDQVGDTEGGNTGETVHDDVPYGSHGFHNTLEEESVSCASMTSSKAQPEPEPEPEPNELP